MANYNWVIDTAAGAQFDRELGFPTSLPGSGDTVTIVDGNVGGQMKWFELTSTGLTDNFGGSSGQTWFPSVSQIVLQLQSTADCIVELQWDFGFGFAIWHTIYINIRPTLTIPSFGIVNGTSNATVTVSNSTSVVQTRLSIASQAPTSGGGSAANGTVIGDTNGNGSFTIVPANYASQEGATVTYDLDYRIPFAFGGPSSGAWSNCPSNPTVVTTRQYDSNPTNLTFSGATATVQTPTITATGTPAKTGNSIYYSLNGSAFSTTNALAQARNVSGAWQAKYRNNGSGVESGIYSENYTPPYNTVAGDNPSLSGPAFGIVDRVNSATITVSGSSSYVQNKLETTGTVPASGTGAPAAGTGVGNTVGNGNITVSTGEYCSQQGASCSYKLLHRVQTALGGDNNYVDTFDTITLTSVIDAPTDLSFSTATTAVASPTVTATGTPAPTTGDTVNLDLYYKKSAGGTYSTSNTAAQGRGNAQTWYVKYRHNTTLVESPEYTESYTPPYLSADSSVTWGSIEQPLNTTATFNLITGTSNVYAVLSGLGGTTDYRVRADSASTNSSVANGDVAGQSDQNGSRTAIDLLLDTVDLPAIGGETCTYEVEARRPTSTGGNNAWINTNVAGVSIGQAFATVAGTIPEPTYGADINATTTATIGVKTPATGNVIQYLVSGGSYSTNRVKSVQRNTSYTYSARNYNTVTGTGGGTISSSSFTVPIIGPELTTLTPLFAYQNNTQTFNQIITGTSNVELRTTGLGVTTDYRVRTDGASTNGSINSTVRTVATSNENGSRTTASFVCTFNGLNASLNEVPQIEGEIAYYVIEGKQSIANGGDDSWQTITAGNNGESSIVQFLSAPDTPIVTYANTSSPTATATITADTSEPTGSSVTYARGGSFTTTRAYSGTRGDPYTYSVRYTNTNSGVFSDSDFTENFPYLNPDLGVTLSGDFGLGILLNNDTNDYTLTISDGSATTNYRSRLVDINQSPNDGQGNRAGNGDITLSYPQELPVSGEYVFYKVQGQRVTANGGDDSWNNCVVQGSAVAATYDLARSPSNTFKLGTVGNDFAETATGTSNTSITIVGPGWAPAFEATGTANATFGGGIDIVRVNEDNDENSVWANANWIGTNSGIGTSTASFTGTYFSFNINGLSGQTASTFRFKAFAESGSNTGVGGGSPFIDVDFTPDSTGTTPFNDDTQTDTFDVTITNTILNFDYFISTDDGTGGNFLGGIGETSGQPPGAKGSAQAGTGGDISLTVQDSAGLANSGDSVTYYVWIRRPSLNAGDNYWYATDTSFIRTRTFPMTLTCTTNPVESIGAGTLVTITGTASIGTGTITGLNLFSLDDTPPTLSAPQYTGLNTAAATVTQTFTSVDLNETYGFKCTATDNLGGSDSSDVAGFVSVKEGGGVTPPTPGTGTYGLEVYNDTGTFLLGTQSKASVFLASGSVAISNNSGTNSSVVAIPGLTDAGERESIVFLSSSASINQVIRESYSISANNLTISVDFTGPPVAVQGTVTVDYWVYKA